MAQIALTLTDGGSTVEINDTQVVTFSANSSTGTLVKYVNEGTILKTIDVTETPTQVQAKSPLFIVLTAVNVVFPSATVTYNTLTGTFIAGEQVVFGQSATNASILTDNGSTSMVVQQVTGANIVTTEAIRGLASGATAAVNGAPTYSWLSSTTFYLNSGRIISIAETGYSGTRTILYADNESPAGNVQYVSETLAAIVTTAASGDYVTLGGAQTISGAKTLSATTTFSGLVLNTGVQALAGAGAANITQYRTNVTSTGANVVTLANGVVGQRKVIAHVVDGGSVIVTPATGLGFTTATLAAVGGTVTLEYGTGGWAVVGSNGCVVA